MRLSTVQGDIGYPLHQELTSLGYKFDVYHNDIHVKYPFTADEEKGYLLEAVPGKDGKVQVNAYDALVLKQHRFGKVKIYITAPKIPDVKEVLAKIGE